MTVRNSITLVRIACILLLLTLTTNNSADGAWSNWSSWGDCSTMCGNGRQSRVRTCDNPPLHNGEECVSSESRTCIKPACPEKDLYIYVATVGLRSSVFATGVITEQDTILRRLTNDESYTSALSEYAHDVLTSFDENRDDIAIYRGLIEDVSTRTMKVRVFVYPTSPRLLRDEQVLVPDLHHFFHLNLNSTYVETENIDIQGTVTCANFYNEKGKPPVTFPMTRTGELAYSLERCYKGAGALASVKCEGGYDDGTSWGRVTYNTGCQTFPDLPESISTKGGFRGVRKRRKVSDDAMCGRTDAGGLRTDGCLPTRNRPNSLPTRNRPNSLPTRNRRSNFALIDFEADSISHTHKAILAIVTKVGLSISIVVLSLIPLTFVLFKHLRKGRGHQVLVNLSVAMLCSSVIFLVGMDRVETKTGCKVVAVLLHYFILVSFAWMLVEGVLQYLRFVKVYGTYIPNFMIKSMIPAWGIPLIPVILVLAIDHDLYYGGKGYCWLETKAMMYAFVIPVAIVLTVNLLLFVLVLKGICCCRPDLSTNQPQWKRACLNLQGIDFTFIILGLTWFFGFMAINKARLLFEYIFAILNIFQGLFIVLRSARSPKVLNSVYRMVMPRV